MGDLGVAYFGLKNYSSAINHFRQSLAIARELRNRTAEGIALNNLGAVLFKSGKLADAEKNLLAAVEIKESRLQGAAEDLEKVFVADTFNNSYQTLQLVLIAQKRIASALEIAERGRAKAFVDLLASRVENAANVTQQIKLT